jgi:phenylacetate-CoA ligase
VSTYFECFDPAMLKRDFPIGDAFLAKVQGLSRDALRAQQEIQFSACVERAWQIPFYQRLWGSKGIEPGDIRSLEDITRLPTFGKHELMESIALKPPFGDYSGRESHLGPVVFHTTSGTTGTPQPLFFGAKGREVQNLLLARSYLLQGLRRDDVVHSVYGHGPINGGHYVREAVVHFTEALFLSAGTGVETRSIRQVELMRDFGVSVIVGFADYIKKLAEVARENGILPGRDIHIRMISGHLGRESKQAMSEAWGGAQLYDWYGVGDTGTIASEAQDQDGMYIHEDAQWVEILDVDSAAPKADGEAGDLVVTCLYKDDIYPLIRFNTHDVTAIKTGHSALGINFRRMAGFLGRSDNMVKLRGINIFPQALGPILEAKADFAGEFICVVTRDAAQRDEMAVLIETRGGVAERPALKDGYRELLKARLGVDVQVELKSVGELTPLTGIDTRQKPIRLIDQRFK